MPDVPPGRLAPRIIPRGFMDAPACITGRLRMSAGEALAAAAPAPPEATGMEIGAPAPTLPAAPPVGAGTEMAGSEIPPGTPLGAAIAGAPIPMTAAITAVRDAIATEFCAVTAVFRSVAVFIGSCLLPKIPLKIPPMPET